MGEETQQSIWNFDGAELYAIFEIKKEFISCLLKWDLEQAYWKIRILRMELDAKFQRENKRIIEEFEEEKRKASGKETGKKLNEKQEVDNKLREVEEFRNRYNEDLSLKGDYYLVLEDFYMYLCHLMKKHGLYFREGDDMRLAVLRR